MINKKLETFNAIFEDYTKYGYKISKNKYLIDGKYPIVDQGQSYITGYHNDENGLFKEVPAILFGDHTRIIKFVNFPFFLGADGVKLLHNKRKDIDTKYLYYILQNTKIPNTGYNRHFKWLKEIKFAIPSFDIQKKIVRTLDNLNNLIDLRKQQLEKLNLLIKSKFIDMFGDSVTNPKGWEIVSLSDIAVFFIGLTYSPKHISRDGIIVLRSSNIQNDILTFDNIVRVKVKIKDNLFVLNNDILMCTRNGSANLVGKTALINNLKEKMTFGAFMTIIRSKYNFYLLTFFRMPHFRRQIITGKTTTVNQITNTMLKNIKVPLPPIELQNEFREFVEETEKQKLLINKSLEKFELLYKSLMQKYFEQKEK